MKTFCLILASWKIANIPNIYGGVSNTESDATMWGRRSKTEIFEKNPDYKIWKACSMKWFPHYLFLDFSRWSLSWVCQIEHDNLFTATKKCKITTPKILVRPILFLIYMHFQTCVAFVRVFYQNIILYHCNQDIYV